MMISASSDKIPATTPYGPAELTLRHMHQDSHLSRQKNMLKCTFKRETAQALAQSQQIDQCWLTGGNIMHCST